LDDVSKTLGKNRMNSSEKAMARLIDTDVLVDFLRGYGKAVAFINAHSERIILSSIAVAELYAGVKGDAEFLQRERTNGRAG